MTRELRIWGPFLVLLLPLIGLISYQRPGVRQARLDAKLIAAVHSHDEAAALKALTEGADPNVHDHYRPLPTLWVRLRHPDAAQEDDDLHVHEWDSVLASAMAFGWEGGQNNRNDEIVQALLKHGANVNGRDSRGGSALSDAACQGRLDWTTEFLDHGADTGSKDEALSSAALWGQTAIVHLLIARGANVNARDHDGSTPLEDSCTQRHIATVRLLLSQGADPSLRTLGGKTVLQNALSSRRPDPALIQLLRDFVRRPISSPRSPSPS